MEDQSVYFGLWGGVLVLLAPYGAFMVNARAIWPCTACCFDSLYEGPGERLTDDGQAYCEGCDEPLGLRFGERCWLWGEDWEGELQALLSYSLDPLASILAMAPLLDALTQLRGEFQAYGEACWELWAEDDERFLVRLPAEVPRGKFRQVFQAGLPVACR